MAALRAVGWQVVDVHTGPLCDLVAWKIDDPLSVRLIEVKTPKIGRATESQKSLKARGCPIHVVTSPEQAAQLR